MAIKFKKRIVFFFFQLRIFLLIFSVSIKKIREISWLLFID